MRKQVGIISFQARSNKALQNRQVYIQGTTIQKRKTAVQTESKSSEIEPYEVGGRG